MRVALNGLFLQAPATGTGQYLREVVQALKHLSPQDEFVFIAPHADSTAPAPVQLAPTTFRSENLAKLEFEQWTFPRASRRGFDLAHVPHFGSPLRTTRPTVVTIHDLIPLVVPAYRGSLLVRLYTWLAGRSARRANAILADSYASARDVEARLNLPRSRIHAVHLAADARFHPQLPSEIERVREKYGLPERFALYLGGFDVRKDVRRVVETFAMAQQTSEGAEGKTRKMVVAGKLPVRDSEFFPDPRKAAMELGIKERVHFPGFIDEADKPALYAAARVFMYPSRYEGFGLPLLEAMAVGTPVIAANSSSLPEVVGEGGILLDADDAQAWREALGALLDNEAFWNEQRVRGLRQAQNFSWARTAQQTLEVYRSVV